MVYNLGDEILRCSPFVSLVSSKFRKTVCDTCFKASDVKLNHCGRCHAVFYCNQQCQSISWKEFHRQECSFLQKSSLSSDMIRLMARVIFKLYLGGGKIVGEVPDGGGKRCFDDLLSHSSEILLDKDKKAHFQRCFEVLRTTMTDLLPPAPDVLEIFGRLVTNSFSVLNDDCVAIGTALYLEASVFDHSCVPNASVVFEGNKLILRCIDGSIPGIKDVRISYVNLNHSTERRRQYLKETYYFQCECSACQDENQDQLKTRSPLCPECLTTIVNQDDFCFRCKKNVSIVKYVSIKEKLSKLLSSKLSDSDEALELYAVQVQESMSPLDETALDFWTALYEKRIESKDWNGALEAAEAVLISYRKYSHKYEFGTAVWLLKSAKLRCYLDMFRQARGYLEEAEKILKITHDPKHPLIKVTLKNLKTDVETGLKQMTSSVLHNNNPCG